MLVEARSGHPFAFFGNFTLVVWLPQGNLPEGVSDRARAGRFSSEKGSRPILKLRDPKGGGGMCLG